MNASSFLEIEYVVLFFLDGCEDRNGEMGQDEEMDLDPAQFEDADDFESQ